MATQFSESRQNFVILACGSFNPIHYGHLALFQRAKEFIERECHCHLLEVLISPVADAYEKPGLISAHHRLKMCELAVDGMDWVNVDRWEAEQPVWSPNQTVLEHHRAEVNQKWGKYLEDVRLVLLCGSDIIETFLHPKDIGLIVERFPILAIKRGSSKASKLVDPMELTTGQLSNINVIEEGRDFAFRRRISSTKIRESLKNGESIQAMVPEEVADYIKENRLYV